MARVSEVIMGQVYTAGGGQNPARQAAKAAGKLTSETLYFVMETIIVRHSPKAHIYSQKFLLLRVRREAW